MGVGGGGICISSLNAKGDWGWRVVDASAGVAGQIPILQGTAMGCVFVQLQLTDAQFTVRALFPEPVD